MQLQIEMPEDILEALKQGWGDLSRHALEALAIEGYRSGALTAAQVRRMLGYETRMEVDALLKRAGVFYDYTEEELEREIEANRRLLGPRQS